MDITQDELVEAYVDFSREKLGFEPNLTSCAEALIVTKADGVTPLDYSFKKAPTDYKGHCSGVGLWFNWGYNRLDDIDKIWKKDQIKTFYVYTTNKSITELKVTDVSKYYTSYVWTDFTKKNDTYTSGVNIYSAAKPYSVNLSCQPCGLEGQSCCEPGDKCATPSSLTCNSSKLCEPCGQVGQTCCAGGYACGGSGTYGACAIGACCNTSNKCYTCGKLDQACCPSNKCSNAAYGCNTALDPDACKYKLKCWKVRHCGNGWGDGCGSCDTGIACQDTAPTCKYGKCDLSGDDTCTANSFTRCDTKYWHSRHCGAGLLDICGKCDTGNNCSTTAPTCQYNDCKPPFGSGGKLTCTADTYSTGGYGTV
jgi:hypothetical protein